MQPIGCLVKTNKAMSYHEQRPDRPPSRTDELRERWKQLPEEERHLLLAEWLSEYLETDEERELLRELEGVDQRIYPTNAISKADLIYARPDLVAHLLTLSSDDIREIAAEIGDRSMDSYWTTIDYVLSKTYKIADTESEKPDHSDEPQ